MVSDSLIASDFLPFTCSDCSKTFCLEHKFPDAHNCSKVNVKVKQADPDVCIHRKCCVDGCNAIGTAVVICECCSLEVCLSHRHKWDHKCLEKNEEEINKTAEHVKQILASKPEQKPKARLSAKAEKTAAKVALIKLKMKAVGDRHISPENRVHLLIFFPKEKNLNPKGLYFYKCLKLGKMIDKISDSHNIKNVNNTSLDKCLALFSCRNGQRLPMEQTLEDVVSSEEIFDGSSVILEYAISSCQYLENYETYVI